MNGDRNEKLSDRSTGVAGAQPGASATDPASEQASTDFRTTRTVDSRVMQYGVTIPQVSAESIQVLNVAAYLPRMAAVQPTSRAIIVADGNDHTRRGRWRSWSYAELNASSERLARGFESEGIRRGMRVIVLIQPGFDCFAVIFALFRIAAVPVIIDPGMGMSAMAECLGRIEAEAFVGVPAAHVLRLLLRRHFASIRILVTVGRRWFWGGKTLSQVKGAGRGAETVAGVDTEETAAILFTTGSTGPAKPVVYSHGVFAAQLRMLRNHFGIRPGEVDLATFLLFGLFAPGLGMTAVLPEMDYTRPGFVDPRKIIAAIEDHRITNMFGSPALLDRVGRFGEENGIRLPTLRRVITAGAPVRRDVLERFSRMLERDAEIHTPYGATEALPVASIGSHELLGDLSRAQPLSTTKAAPPPVSAHASEQATVQGNQASVGGVVAGWGVCVGRPLHGVDVRIIRITEEPIAEWSDDLELPIQEIGEIVVRGPMVTRTYYGNPTANALAKIPFHTAASGVDRVASGRAPGTSETRPDDFFHRMGDVGYFDVQGRLWMCGRKSHRVVTRNGTLYTIPCETVFNRHPRVRRTALVGIGTPGTQTPVLCVELAEGDPKRELQNLTAELLMLGSEFDHTRLIRTILFHQGFPVDIRHNAKIFREKLAVWAARKLNAN